MWYITEQLSIVRKKINPIRVVRINEAAFTKSSIYTTKSNGPRTLPWGTPLYTSKVDENELLTHTFSL